MTAPVVRNRAIRALREFFRENNIIEVRTPKAVRSGALEPYIDTLSLAGEFVTASLCLATSPEFSLKKIYAEELKENPGTSGIYEIAPVFRDDRPGKNHALEFTMVEWYSADTMLPQLIWQAAACIARLAPDAATSKLFGAGIVIRDLREIFAANDAVLDYRRPESIVEEYLKRHNALPHHHNSHDLTIACFNLLFDEIILPWLRSQKEPVAVSGYPELLAAMAYTENGVAERAEIYWQGMELANAYREEWRPDVIRQRWQYYNEIRILRNVPVHVPDEEMLAGLGDMRGVCGVALGLERALSRFFPGLNFFALF